LDRLLESGQCDIFGGMPPSSKPIDRWLVLGGAVLAIMLFLIAKTPVVVILCVLSMFGLLVHPVWNFWWIEEAARRRIGALCLLAVALFCIGAYVWPMPPGSSATKLYIAIDALWAAFSGMSQRSVDRLTGALVTLIALASIPLSRRIFRRLENRKKISAQTKGFLDYKLEAETAMAALPSLLGRLTVITAKVGPTLERHTRELGNAPTTEQQIGVTRKAARSLDRFSSGIDKVLIDYESTGATLVEGLDG
jgi:hypothetical protein